LRGRGQVSSLASAAFSSAAATADDSTVRNSEAYQAPFSIAQPVRSNQKYLIFAMDIKTLFHEILLQCKWAPPSGHGNAQN
jgi:hypothetical protein